MSTPYNLEAGAKRDDLDRKVKKNGRSSTTKETKKRGGMKQISGKPSRNHSPVLYTTLATLCIPFTSSRKHYGPVKARPCLPHPSQSLPQPPHTRKCPSTTR
uniref:Uncharacterized protein n=1 Tax=Trypanosoma congolense (strain IL3000) TaxID=1068625 RepID=G0UZG4_TRYCI|nr:hypothetical protein, unlikely [Trypanosoma congolense IL3000]